MNESESHHRPEQVHNSTDYQRLLHEAQADTRTFLPGEVVTIIDAEAGAEPVKGQVLKVEDRLNTEEHRHYDYVHVGYDAPVSEDPRLGTYTKVIQIRADKLARMQITDAEILAASPGQEHLESAIADTPYVAPESDGAKDRRFHQILGGEE